MTEIFQSEALKHSTLNESCLPGIAYLEGARACPPEDVGGVPGYYEFCEALKDPNHEEHGRYVTWSGGDYDSEEFDSNEVNWELMPEATIRKLRIVQIEGKREVSRNIDFYNPAFRGMARGKRKERVFSSPSHRPGGWIIA